VSAPAAPGPCPRCGADDPLPVLYGYPAFDEEEQLPDRVVFAGCVVPPDPRAWACGRCGLHYGERLRFGADEDG